MFTSQFKRIGRVVVVGRGTQTSVLLQQHRQFSSKISAAMVKELREKSGAGMMDCKKALGDKEVNGDFAKAMDWLRAKGIARATSSATRTASEGVIAAYTREKDGSVTLLELNSETDFVSRNADFHTLAKAVLLTASTGRSTATATASAGTRDVGAITVPDLLSQPAVGEGGKKSVSDLLIDAISTIRENITIRRALHCCPPSTDSIPSGTILGVYVHGKVCGDITIEGDNGGIIQIGTQAAVVALRTTPPITNNQSIQILNNAARKLAMHTVAAAPLYLSMAHAPAEFVERETSIFREQAVTANAATAKPKSPDMLEKIIAGKLNKRLNEQSLLGQVHMAEASGPVVGKYVQGLGEEVGEGKRVAVEVGWFSRWQLGGAGSGEHGSVGADDGNDAGAADAADAAKRS